MRFQQKNDVDRETRTLQGSSLGGSYQVKGLLMGGLQLLILLTLQVTTHYLNIIINSSINSHVHSPVENLRNLTHTVQDNDPEDTYYSRVLIEDSSSTSTRNVPSYGTRDSSRYYYQGGGTGRGDSREPPRGLFDDV